MSKSKKRKPLPPRVKRMKRPARLASAKKWIPTYTGKNLLRGYCNHYAVNWRCAAIELNLLGIRVDPDYLAKRERSEINHSKQRQARKEELESLQNEHWHPFTDTYSAYLAGDFVALHDLELRERYGDQYDDLTMIEHRIGNSAYNIECEDDIELLRIDFSNLEDDDGNLPF